MKSSNNSNITVHNEDGVLPKVEGILSDLAEKVTARVTENSDNSERLIYIYTLTAIIVCTVIVTFCRSFFFFSVSLFIFLCKFLFFGFI